MGWLREDFPRPAEYDQLQRRFYLIVETPGERRFVYFSSNTVPEQGKLGCESLSLEQLSEDHLARRMVYVQNLVRERGNDMRDFTWSQGKVSKKAKDFFCRWAEHMLAGGSPNDDVFWNELSETDAETQDRLYRSVNRYGHRMEDITARRGDLFALYGPKQDRVPELIVGDLPPVDWCLAK